jgi:hypothetical protein
MNKITEKKINDIEKQFSVIEKLINANKTLTEEEKEELIYSVRYIIKIIYKYVIRVKNV